jgi:hypothetical protein
VDDVLGRPHPADVERQTADAVEDALARAQRDRHDVQPEFVDRT